MATHFDHVQEMIPALAQYRIFDVGAGRGEFVIDATRRGVDVRGIEYNPEKVAIAQRAAAAAGVSIDMRQGDAEHLPFADASFDFLNMCELIEHVQHPEAALREAFRVLVPGAAAYISVPSRFSWYDTHFHVPFVNWLPRVFSDAYISLFGRHKPYVGAVDIQRLREMHYYTYDAFVREASRAGFMVEDLRERKLRMRVRNRILRWGAIVAYRCMRPWYFRTFHILIHKP